MGGRGNDHQIRLLCPDHLSDVGVTVDIVLLFGLCQPLPGQIHYGSQGKTVGLFQDLGNMSPPAYAAQTHNSSLKNLHFRHTSKSSDLMPSL